jgi:hypothetical protein
MADPRHTLRITDAALPAERVLTVQPRAGAAAARSAPGAAGHCSHITTVNGVVRMAPEED